MISQERLQRFLKEFRWALKREGEPPPIEDLVVKSEEMDQRLSDLLECFEELERHRAEYRWKVDRPPVEGVAYQYLGVYILKWKPEWGEPLVGVYEEMPWEDDDEQV